MLLNTIEHFTFLLILLFYFDFLEEFLWRNAEKILETSFPNAGKVEKERQDQGQKQPHYLCNLK